jgi:LysR family transcriptional regulator, glycine cleavage system transcriptional activator
MQRELPNLDWLRVFAVTAETESFALAAQQLGVTPGAVSQRIKSLEGFLGVTLFQRHAQGVRLTEAGRLYARRAAPPLEQLAQATREVLSAKNGKTLKVTVLPAFAQLWLGPRLAQFHKLDTGAAVEVWADALVVDLPASDFDVAIRYGRPPFPGCDHHPILFDELVPVASPALIEASRLVARGLPTGAALLLDTYWTSDFDDWLARTGQSGPADLVTQTFSLYSMVVEAALNGQGFMIGHTSLVADLLAQGRLRALSDRRVPAAKQFHLLTKAAAPLSEPAEAFVEWIREQTRPAA